MKVTLVLCLVTLAVASADVGLGYHYKVPQTSYGVPSYQTTGNSGQYSSAFAGTSGFDNRAGNQGAGYQAAGYQGAGYQGAGYQGTGYQGTGYQSAGYQTGNSQTANIQSTSGLSNGVYQTASSSGVSGAVVQPSYNTGFQSQYETSSQYQGSALNKYQQQYQVQQQQAQIFKHFYVHAAPEEPIQVKPRTPIVLPPPQKHYKIIFVKTPTETSAPQIIAPIQPQNEEKTIVYVLVKKPDEPQDVVLPKIEQKPPSKPEVYFIKYKNKEDSQALINNIVQDYNDKSVSVAGAESSGSSIASALSNTQYQTPEQISTGSFGSSSFGVTGSSSSSNSEQSESKTASSTASSTGYESASAISTSQGVPHETYGPPKFRVN